MGKKFDEVKSSVSCSYLFEAQGQFDRLAETLGGAERLASALVKSHLRCQLPQFLARFAPSDRQMSCMHAAPPCNTRAETADMDIGRAETEQTFR